jgi:hypothetical protein
MTREQYNRLPNAEKIEPGDTINFCYPGQRPETGLYVEKISDVMCEGKNTMMATARTTISPLRTDFKIMFGKTSQSAIYNRSSYDLDYCKIAKKRAVKSITVSRERQ